MDNGKLIMENEELGTGDLGLEIGNADNELQTLNSQLTTDNYILR